MRKPAFRLYLVAWTGGAFAASFRVDWLGLWPGLIAVFLISIVTRFVFDLILSRYWLSKE